MGLYDCFYGANLFTHLSAYEKGIFGLAVVVKGEFYDLKASIFQQLNAMTWAPATEPDAFVAFFLKALGKGQTSHDVTAAYSEGGIGSNQKQHGIRPFSARTSGDRLEESGPLDRQSHSL